jgi:hypothetical protein
VDGVELEDEVPGRLRPGVPQAVDVACGAVDDAERRDPSAEGLDHAVEHHDCDVVLVSVRLVSGSRLEDGEMRVEQPKGIGRPFEQQPRREGLGRAG